MAKGVVTVDADDPGVDIQELEGEVCERYGDEFGMEAGSRSSSPTKTKFWKESSCDG